MILAYNFLKEILKEYTPSLDELTNKLINIGFEVEDLIKHPLNDIITVRAKNVEKIESLNNLYKVEVTDGENTITVVTSWEKIKICGIYTYASPNTLILGKTLEKKQFGDVISDGMLLSFKELSLNPDFLSAVEREGIMELPDDTPIGHNFYELFNLSAPLLNLKVPFNRSDCYSFLGILREIGAAFSISIPQEIKNKPNFIYPSFNSSKIKRETAKKDFKGVKILNKEGCPYYSCTIINNISVNRSPYEIRKSLFSFGIRPINNVVDIANLIMYFYGQPLHTFDLNNIGGREIIVRTSNDTEELNAIDGKTYPLTEEDLVIADDLHPIALAGIIGGRDSEIKNNSKCVLIEAAFFNPLYINRTSERLNINTDASIRYSRIVDRTRTKELALMATNLIATICNGTILGEILEYGSDEYKPQKIDFSIGDFKKVTGIELSKYTATHIMSKLEIPFEIKSQDYLTIKVPPFRENDIKETVDIIEDILRFVGYDKITPKASPFYVKYEDENYNYKVKNKLRNLLIGLGFSEVVTDSFVKDEEISLIYGNDINNLLRVKNPIKSGLSFLSPDKIIGFCSVIQHNINRKHTDLKFFEIGKHYMKYSEEEFLDIILSGNRNIENWLEKPLKVDFYYGKGIIESLFIRFNVPYKEKKNINSKIFDTDESVDFFIDNSNIGSFGKVNKNIRNYYDINQDIFYATIKLSFISKYILQIPKFTPIPQTQEIVRDIALVVDDIVKVGDIIDKIKSLANSSLTNITLFDVYKGDNIPEGKKSVALRLNFNFGLNKTSEQIQKTLDEIINNVCYTFSAKLRK